MRHDETRDNITAIEAAIITADSAEEILVALRHSPEGSDPTGRETWRERKLRVALEAAAIAADAHADACEEAGEPACHRVTNVTNHLLAHQRPETFEEHMQYEETADADYRREAGFVETYSDEHLMRNNGI